jgi:two-component system, NtrC family, response regulator AtoC
LKHPTQSKEIMYQNETQQINKQWLRRQGQELIEAIGEILPNSAMFIVDGNQKIIYWSPQAESLLGWAADEVVGEFCLKSNRCLQCIEGCGIQQHRNIQGATLTLLHKDGSNVTVNKYARAFFDGDIFRGAVEILTGNMQGSSSIREKNLFHDIHTRSQSMEVLFSHIQNVAQTDVSVLVRGESGVGKELVAKAIHEESHRSKKPFVAINCSALSETLMDSELFGHEKGAFTGANQQRIGLFERAKGGTLFLDEVAELPLSTQAKLLRVLEERTIVRVGGNQDIPINTRILAATHKSLRKQVKDGLFREDLMYRLRVVPLFIPPLRERKQDIELLLWHFITLRNQSSRRQITSIAPEAMQLFLQHPWPGNIRELRNVVDYAFAIGQGNAMSHIDLPPEFHENPIPNQPSKIPVPESRAHSTLIVQPPSFATPPKQVFIQTEKERIHLALEQAEGHLGKAAKILNISRATLWRKRQKHDL